MISEFAVETFAKVAALAFIEFGGVEKERNPLPPFQGSEMGLGREIA